MKKSMVGTKSLALSKMILSIIAISFIVSCAKKSDDNNKATPVNPPIYKTVTRENYLSGKQFCQTYNDITGKEFGRYVTVPKYYNNPSAGTMEIYVYSMSVFDPNKPTYIYVDGGPGQNTHGMMPNYFDGKYNELRFDQRGLGCSAPLTFDEYKDASLYSSENNIRDMDLIRKEYGIEKWTVYGVSYGTVPATMYASKYPYATQSLVIEGVIGDLSVVHDLDYKASKLNLAIENLNASQRKSLADMINGDNPEYKGIFNLMFQEFYMDKGMRSFSDLLPKVIFQDGTINHYGLQKLNSYFEARDNNYPHPQQPGVTDTNILNIIYCKNLNAANATDKDLHFSSTGGFYTTTNYFSNARKKCDSFGVFAADEKKYTLEENPVTVPVYYFQGSHDGATLAKGAITHWQIVPQGKSYFMLAQKGGHNPNMTRVESQNSVVASAEKTLMLAAIAGTDISKQDLVTINSAVSFDEKWILFRENETSSKDINSELEGISLVKNLVH